MSRSGYHSWVKRGKDIDSPCAAKKEQQEQLKEKFRKIMRKLGYAPRKRTLQIHLQREFSISISIKHYRKITKEMDFVTNRFKKDTYKNQATHNHEYSSPRNVVKQNLPVGPCKVILADITYLYYDLVRTPIYLYTFRDAYTKEILGHCVSSRMTVLLVRSAYDVMVEDHGHKLRDAVCMIHSDQGSRHLSTTFQRLLSDDGFLQPTSDRGNSQGNVPMESFSGRLKCELLDLVALCPDASTVNRMISGYIDACNHQYYQYVLAELTPSEYYTYVTTGIYPVGNYYGIKATKLMPIQTSIVARCRMAEEKAKKYREANAKKRAMAQGKKKDPEFVIARNQRILRREVAKWARSKEPVLQQISHLGKTLELSQKARAYLMTASAGLILQLYSGKN